jgi:hypothetical protein
VHAYTYARARARAHTDTHTDAYAHERVHAYNQSDLETSEGRAGRQHHKSVLTETDGRKPILKGVDKGATVEIRGRLGKTWLADCNIISVTPVQCGTTSERAKTLILE